MAHFVANRCHTRIPAKLVCERTRSPSFVIRVHPRGSAANMVSPRKGSGQGDLSTRVLDETYKMAMNDSHETESELVNVVHGVVHGVGGRAMFFVLLPTS